MADFLQAHKLTMKIEGGYSNDKDDKGGRTYKGIASASAPKWQGWPIIEAIIQRVGEDADKINVDAEKNETLQALVLKFYKTEYWDSLCLDQLSDQRVADELYDTGVNMGTGRASLFFQRVLNTINRNGNT